MTSFISTKPSCKSSHSDKIAFEKRMVPQVVHSCYGCFFIVAVIAFLPQLASAQNSKGPADKSPSTKNEGAIEITLKPSQTNPTLQEINSGRYKIKVTIKNVSDKEATIWPFLNVSVKTARGTDVKRSIRIGRWGLIGAPSRIEAIPYKELKPGQTHDVEINLKQFQYDPEMITGWKIPSTGRYKISVGYEVKKDQIKSDFGKGCKRKTLNDPTQPWNKLVDAKVSRTIRLNLKK